MHALVQCRKWGSPWTTLRSFRRGMSCWRATHARPLRWRRLQHDHGLGERVRGARAARRLGRREVADAGAGRSRAPEPERALARGGAARGRRPVLRGMCPEDRRGIIARVTDSGRERYEAARPTHRECSPRRSASPRLAPVFVRSWHDFRLVPSRIRALALATAVLTVLPAAAEAGEPVSLTWGGDVTLGSSYGQPPRAGWPQLAPIAPVLRASDLAVVELRGHVRAWRDRRARRRARCASRSRRRRATRGPCFAPVSISSTSPTTTRTTSGRAATRAPGGRCGGRVSRRPARRPRSASLRRDGTRSRSWGSRATAGVRR